MRANTASSTIPEITSGGIRKTRSGSRHFATESEFATEGLNRIKVSRTLLNRVLGLKLTLQQPEVHRTESSLLTPRSQVAVPNGYGQLHLILRLWLRFAMRFA